jgi:small-conductance mechanosensitive channel
MANLSPAAAPEPAPGLGALGWARLISLAVFAALLAVCLIFAWTTRDAMEHLPFLASRGSGLNPAARQKTLVDLSPWQTAQALAPLAVSAEEAEFGRDAERLADHEVVQAFNSALRQGNLDAEHRVLSGEALTISQRVVQLQQLVKDDQTQVDKLTAAAPNAAAAAKAAANDDPLELAKAQLALDSDQLQDAQQDLQRASGDDRARIQSELAAHQATVAKQATEPKGSQAMAVTSVAQQHTLAHRIVAWRNQGERTALIRQAVLQCKSDEANLITLHNALEAKADAALAASKDATADMAAKIKDMREGSAERQLLSIYDDRIQTEQQLAEVYSKWETQVALQHRILLHLIMQSCAWILVILIVTILCDALLRRLLAHPVIDRRQMHTLRALVQLGVQVIGALLILFVIFGTPREITTVLGLTTAGLTIALQDFILAFFGWFVLMGKGGIRIGDWVEIDGVSGEVTEIGLMNTSLLETGDVRERGHPTGRQISFLNSFAIRGKYFNFSTEGQWMWDEINVTLPPGLPIEAVVERIHTAVVNETAESAGVAELEWKRGKRHDGLGRFSADPVVNLRPSVAGIALRVRYVTRASERLEVRNRLYRIVVDLLEKEKLAVKAQPVLGDGKSDGK